VFLTVEGRDCSLSFVIGAHLDKPESLASAGFTVADDFRARHGSVLREQLFQIRAGCGIAQIPDV
jgi:hypothetical protein